MGYIYIIKNKINSKVYIGQTRKTINDRWKEHLSNVFIRDQAIYLAMRKYGIENFYIEELEYVENDNYIDNREIFYIRKYNSLAPNGYNLILTGKSFKNDNPMFHPEIAQKVSKHFIGDKNPAKRPEVKEKIRQSRLGTKASAETRKKMSENNRRYWKGKSWSEEHKKQFSETHWCKGRFRGLNPNSKRVARLNKNTLETLEEYDSIQSAIDWVHNNISSIASATNISRVCNNKQKTAFGFSWKFI